MWKTKKNRASELLNTANIKITEAVVYRTEILKKELNLQSVDGLSIYESKLS